MRVMVRLSYYMQTYRKHASTLLKGANAIYTSPMQTMLGPVLLLAALLPAALTAPSAPPFSLLSDDDISNHISVLFNATYSNSTWFRFLEIVLEVALPPTEWDLVRQELLACLSAA